MLFYFFVMFGCLECILFFWTVIYIYSKLLFFIHCTQITIIFYREYEYNINSNSIDGLMHEYQSPRNTLSDHVRLF